MPPSVEINCFTILIDRQSRQNGLYRRGGAFARIRLDFCVMRHAREWGMGSRRQGIRERERRREGETERGRDGETERRRDCLSVSALPLSLCLSFPLFLTPRHPHTRFTSVRKP